MTGDLLARAHALLARLEQARGTLWQVSANDYETLHQLAQALELDLPETASWSLVAMVGLLHDGIQHLEARDYRLPS
jgi:hypothetical protein